MSASLPEQPIPGKFNASQDEPPIGAERMRVVADPDPHPLGGRPRRREILGPRELAVLDLSLDPGDRLAQNLVDGGVVGALAGRLAELLVGLQQRGAPKSLGRLDQAERRPIERLDHQALGLPFDGVRARQGGDGRTDALRGGEDPGEEVGRGEGSSGIVNQDPLDLRESLEPGEHREGARGAALGKDQLGSSRALVPLERRAGRNLVALRERYCDRAGEAGRHFNGPGQHRTAVQIRELLEASEAGTQAAGGHDRAD